MTQPVVVFYTVHPIGGWHVAVAALYSHGWHVAARFHLLRLRLSVLSLSSFPYCSEPRSGIVKGGLRYLIFWSRKNAFVCEQSIGRGQRGGGGSEACPRAVDRPLLINFGSDRLARTRMAIDKGDPGASTSAWGETKRREKMATAGNETRIGGQCRLGRRAREHPSRRRPSRGVDRVDRHARDHPCVVYARYAVIGGGSAKGERRYYTGEPVGENFQR